MFLFLAFLWLKDSNHQKKRIQESFRPHGTTSQSEFVLWGQQPIIERFKTSLWKFLIEKTGSIADFSEKEFAYLKRVNQIAGNIKAVLDMEKAYADIDLEKLEEDLDIDADGLMEELSDLLMKELTGLDLDSDALVEDSDVENADTGAIDPTTAELPFEQCSVEDCDSKPVTDDKILESEEEEDNSIIEADSSEEVARAIAASVLR